MNTLIYSAIGLIVIFSATFLITFNNELLGKWRLLTMRVRSNISALGRKYFHYHKAV